MVNLGIRQWLINKLIKKYVYKWRYDYFIKNYYILIKYYKI